MPKKPEVHSLPGSVTYRAPTYKAVIDFASVDGRAVPCSVTIHWLRPIDALNGIDSSHLRDLPLGRIVAYVNSAADERVRKVVSLGGELALSHDSPFLRAGIPDLRVEIPAGRRYPDEFYERVAAMYVALTSNGERHPAQRIAEVNDVPVATVHRWIKEARHRTDQHGRPMLAPARQGRAG